MTWEEAEMLLTAACADEVDVRIYREFSRFRQPNWQMQRDEMISVRGFNIELRSLRFDGLAATIAVPSGQPDALREAINRVLDRIANWRICAAEGATPAAMEFHPEDVPF